MAFDIMKPIEYNRNLLGSRRPHKGISKMPKECINNLAKRLEFESKQLNAYLDRCKR